MAHSDGAHLDALHLHLREHKDINQIEVGIFRGLSDDSDACGLQNRYGNVRCGTDEQSHDTVLDTFAAHGFSSSLHDDMANCSLVLEEA